MLDATVWYKVQVKKLILQEVQTGFISVNVMDQRIGRSINSANEKEIVRMTPIPTYMVYDVFERDLDAAAAMVY